VLTTSGAVCCWGQGVAGQLGSDNAVDVGDEGNDNPVQAKEAGPQQLPPGVVALAAGVTPPAS